MNDLDHPDLDARLTDLLARSATAVEVRRDLDGVTSDTSDLPVLDRSSPRRSVLAVAAGVLVVLLAVGAVAVRSDDHGEPVAVVPAVGGAYPVADRLPAAVADDVFIVNVVESRDSRSTGPMAMPSARAVIGVRGRAGGVSAMATVLLGRPGPQPFDAVEGEDLLVGGRRAKVTASDSGTSVVIEGDPLLIVDGPGDVVGLLAQIPVGGLETGWDGDTPTLTLSGGPQVVVAPGPRAEGPSPTLNAGPEVAGGPSVVVATQVDEPLAELALAGAGEVVPIDVGGIAGYLVSTVDGGSVAWTTADGTNVVVRVAGLGPEDPVRVARSVRLVDEATWLATYDRHGPALDPEDTVTLPPSTTELFPAPLVGQPAPALPGNDTNGTPVTYDGHWTVVGLTAASCPDEPCADVLAALAELDANRPTLFDGVGAGPTLQLVALVDGETVGAVGAVRDAAAEAGFDGHTIPAAAVDLVAAWGIANLPAVTIVDPSGTVVSVQSGGPIDAASIGSALASAAGEG